MCLSTPNKNPRKELPKTAFLLFLTLLFSYSHSEATNYTATGGAWNVAASWGGAGTPGSGDDATIPAGKTITVPTGTVDVQNLTVQNGGILNFNSNAGILKVHNDGSVNVDNGGQIQDNNTSTQIIFEDNNKTFSFVNNGTYAIDQLSFNGDNSTVTVSGGGTTTIGRVSFGANSISVTFNNTTPILVNANPLTVATNNITMNGTGTLNLSSGGNGDLNINGNGTSIGCVFILSDDLTASGSTGFTLTSGASITSSSDIRIGPTATVTNNCNVVINSGASISATGSILLDGDNVGGASNFSLDNSGTFSLGTNIDINTETGASFTNSGSFTLTGSVINDPAANGTFTNNANATFTIGGDIDNDMTLNFSASGNTVNYNSNGGTDVEDPSGNNYYHLTIGGTSNRLLRDDITVGGNLLLQNTAILNSNTHDITVNGNWSNTSTNADPFVEGTRTVTLINSSAAQSIPNTGNANGTAFYNLTINNTYSFAPQVTLDANVGVTNQLTMSSGYINLNSYTLTLGTSPASKGNLSYTSGLLYNGTFTRWFTTIALADGNSNGLFPVGAANDYRPFYVAPTVAPSAGGTISVTHTDATTVTNVSFADGASTVQKRHDSYWTLSTANGLANGTYDLRMEGTGFGVITDVNDLRLTLSGSVVGAAGINGGVPSNPIVRRTGLALGNLTNSFYLGSVNPFTSPLPVALQNFNAQYDKERRVVNFKWTTASEKNNSLFTIERTTDNQIFETVVSVNGAGNSSSVNNYNAVDETPVSGTSYYRIKQVDFDGHATYSMLVSVKTDAEILFSVYPNPSGRANNLFVNLQGSSAKEILVVVTDLTGREAYTKVTPSYRQGTFMIASEESSKLAPGIYLITATSDNVVYNQKLIIR